MQLPNIVVFDTAFKKSFGKLIKLEIPASTALKLVKTIKIIDNQTIDVLKVRDGLLERYTVKGEVTSDGAPVFNGDEASKQFNQEMNELLGETFDIPLTEKIKLPEHINIAVEDILNLESIIEID